MSQSGGVEDSGGQREGTEDQNQSPTRGHQSLQSEQSPGSRRSAEVRQLDEV